MNGLLGCYFCTAISAAFPEENITLFSGLNQDCFCSLTFYLSDKVRKASINISEEALGWVLQSKQSTEETVGLA